MEKLNSFIGSFLIIFDNANLSEAFFAPQGIISKLKNPKLSFLKKLHSNLVFAALCFNHHLFKIQYGFTKKIV